MKKIILLTLILFVATTNYAQRLLSWSPEFPNDNSSLTFIVDCNKGNQGLLNFEGGSSANVFVHLGVNTNLSTGPSDWKYVKFPNFNVPNAAANATPLGGNRYSYTIPNVRTFFNVPASETINKVNIIFRNGTGTTKQVNSDVSDMYLPIYPLGQFAVRLNLPPFEPRFNPFAEPLNLTVGSTVAITGVANNNAVLTLKLNGTTINTATSANTISATPSIATACEQKIMYEGNDGTGIKKDSFSFFIPPTTNTAPIPAGMVEGINYATNNTSATLVLFAPNKTTVNVIGDFNNWTPTCATQMNKTADGNYYWLTLTGLTAGVEYGFQYLVDNTIKIADPYCQKILDQFNDPFINNITYPNLKPYPVGLTSGIVGILQTAEPQYTWQVNNFVKPDKRNLITYELLIRDFTAEHSYQSLIDSIQYLKGIGINSIELMPINEFDNNESWGYNPSFYFAPDKYYGTKNKLKEFIDICHLNGIAVILDVVYNHCTGNAPQAALYWNAATNEPTANNPWLNVTATHPYSVFNDFNHNATATKYLFTRNLNFWLDEYKVDGFRFDLAKGFSQTITNTTTVENYDPARVANLKYYYNNSVPTHLNTYMILEFLGSTPSQEEQEYATHGFMLWGNMNSQYSQCTMGYNSNSNISNISYNASGRNFNNPALFGYMQSHDEERTMYRNLQNGNAVGAYDVKNLNTALAREEAAAAVFFTVPGPKMIWQFEERGYDVSIFFGGSNVSNKPPRWEYMNNPNRRKLYDTYKKMIDFRLANQNIFNNTNFSYDFFNGGGLVKTLQIEDPNTAGKKITVVANLDVVQQTKTITFQASGNWINYVANGTGTGINGTTDNTFNLTNATQSITLAPGEYHIYVSVPPCATAAPTGTTTVTYCQNATATALTATGTNLLWYTTATGGTGATTAPTPLTTTIGSTTFYVSQTLNNCEGPRLAITVTVGTGSISIVGQPTNTTECETNNVTFFLTTNIQTGVNYTWQLSTNGGTTFNNLGATTTFSNLFLGSITASMNGNKYRCIVTGANVCPQAGIISNVVTLTVNTVANITVEPISTAVCAGVQATFTFAVSGSNLTYQWQSAPSCTGTFTNIVGATTATYQIPSPTIAMNGMAFKAYVSGSCLPGFQFFTECVTLTVNSPAAPIVVTPVTYCQNATATALTATGTNFKWYTTATGGTGNTTAPIPTTSTIGNFNFYVSQTINSCESPRALITVSVTATTAAPTVTSNIAYCQNAGAVPLSATGSNLLWYNASTGGVGNASAPTPSTATIGSVTFYVSQTQSCGESPRASITVTINGLPNAPTVITPINYCRNAIATALTATGSNLLWYTSAIGGTGTSTIIPSTSTVGSFTYYVSQSSAVSCEGPRAPVLVNINAIPSAPVNTSPEFYCENTTATPLSATGTNLLWYSTATGGTGSTIAPIPSTSTPSIFNAYVSQTVAGCESPRLQIEVIVLNTPDLPTVVTPVNYCQGAIAVPLSTAVTNPPNPSIEYNWYTTATGGIGSTTAPTPPTTAIGTTTYYVSASTITPTFGCEGPRSPIVINITAVPNAPIVTTPITYCQGVTVTALTAIGSNLLWYTTLVGGTSSAIAPIPNTTTVGNTSYFVSQTNICASARAEIVVTVIPGTVPPIVTSPVLYCQGDVAIPLTAIGINLRWYTVATGGTSLASAPTPTTTNLGTTIYYVTQTIGVCESPRAALSIIVNAIPVVPTVITPISYCQNTTATALTATGTNLKWYINATGGTALGGAPTPITTSTGNTIYYVSQTTGTCEGPRAAITITINAIPNAPIVAAPITYCQNIAAPILTAIGANLLWYNTATGGTSNATAPTPSTTNVGTTAYYVSQTINGCQGPRAVINVIVNITPLVPTTNNTVTYCQNTSATPLTATGTNLLWYTNATGGIGNATAPTPSTITAGNLTFYVSQTVGLCESPRAAIQVSVTALPAVPTVTTPIVYCQNASAAALTATGSNLNWYTNAIGGTASTTAPIPLTTTAGTSAYYVASVGCAEGPRAAIVVNVTPTPTAPTQLNVTALTFNSATLNWQGAANSFYTIEYKLNNATTYSTAATGITTNSITINNLVLGGNYEWRVSANCATVGMGNTSAKQTFSTIARNNTITILREGFGIKISPNPLSQNAFIDYLLPGTGTVNMSIYTEGGSLVRSFDEGNKIAGQYQKNITNQFNSLVNGTYFIRLSQNGKGISTRFIKL